MEYDKVLEDFKAFKRQILSPRGEGKVSNSIGVYTFYKMIRKHKWYDIGRPLKEHEFYSIIRGVNKLIADEIALGHTITFPSKMGTLELRKFQPSAKFVDGKLKVTYPIDWDSTLKLWFTDPEAKENKILVRLEEKEVYRIKYCKFKANYENKSFYEFTLNKNVRKALKENIKKGLIDTAYIGY